MKTQHKNVGFTLMSVVVSVALIGILALIAKPSVDSIFARARMGEAKTNLEIIRLSQEALVLSMAGTNASKYEQFDEMGYLGSGNHDCSANPETFRVGNCRSLRYNYQSNVNGKYFEVIAHAPSDRAKQYLMAGCAGAGASVYGETTGDVWAISNGGNPEHCRNILDYCPTPRTNNSVLCVGINGSGRLTRGIPDVIYPPPATPGASPPSTPGTPGASPPSTPRPSPTPTCDACCTRWQRTAAAQTQFDNYVRTQSAIQASALATKCPWQSLFFGSTLVLAYERTCSNCMYIRGSNCAISTHFRVRPHGQGTKTDCMVCENPAPSNYRGSPCCGAWSSIIWSPPANLYCTNETITQNGEMRRDCSSCIFPEDEGYPWRASGCSSVRYSQPPSQNLLRRIMQGTKICPP